jgi:hypothetical protein
MSTMGIMVSSDDEKRVKVALSLALHVEELPAEEKMDNMEVYLFAEATALIMNASPELKEMITELIGRGVIVRACTNLATLYEVTAEAGKMGIELTRANATFAHWTKENYTVLSF